MPKNSRKKLGLAAGVAGLMMAGPVMINAAQAAERSPAQALKGGDDGCPQAASAAGALKTIVAAQTDYNRRPAHKKAAKKKAAKKAAKKAFAKRPAPRARKKAARKAAGRTVPPNPC